MFNKVVIFLIIFLSPYYTLAKKNNEVVSVKTTIVKMTDLHDSFAVIGQCKIDQSRSYYATIAGKLDFVSAQQGQKVHAGDVLLIIDKDIAISTLSQATASLKTAEDVYNRNKSLNNQRYVSESILAKSCADFETAKLEYSKAVNKHNNMVITAPFDGEIGIIKPMVGDEIKAGDYLFSIIAKNAITKSILFELPEIFHNVVSVNTDSIISDNNGREIKAKVSSVSQYISDNGTISARITIDSSNKITHGQYVSVNIITNGHKGLAIPEQVIQSDSNGNFVYKINGSKVQRIYVVLGSRINKLVEITSDQIKDGDEVVYEGLTKINDGAEVNIIK